MSDSHYLPNQGMTAYQHWHMENCRCHGPAESLEEIQRSLADIKRAMEQIDASARENADGLPA
jgi:hypothetical protein